MAVPDIFLKLNGIDGESRDDKHAKEIHVDSWSWGVTNGGSASRGGGAGTSRSDVHDMMCQMTLEKAVTNLWIQSCTGKHIDEAVLTQREAGDDPQEYLKITMNEVLVSSVQISSHGGGKPTVSCSLNFAKVKIEYAPQKEDGSLDALVPKTYDIAANKAS